jgi:hypothetical protein
MNRTRPACVLTLGAGNAITGVAEVFDGGAYAPVGVLVGTPAEQAERLASWWGSRAIPEERPRIQEALERLGLDSPLELMALSHGLSLSDQYWLKSVDEDVFWEDINYFGNGFSERLGYLLLHPGAAPAVTLDAASASDPSGSANGMLPKRWAIRGSERVLLKAGSRERHFQEPYNESIATDLYSRLLDADAFVPYRLQDDDGVVVSACANMLTDREELVPASFVRSLASDDVMIDPFERYLAGCRRLGIEGADFWLGQMLACDYILANTDRHFFNFGVIRNVETLECRLAPLFDNGFSLWCDVDILSASTNAWRSKPFSAIPEKQLALVRDWSWYEPSRAEGFGAAVYATLSKGPYSANKFRAEYIGRFVDANLAIVALARDGRYSDIPALIGQLPDSGKRRARKGE